jgi:hypothetical protein
MIVRTRKGRRWMKLLLEGDGRGEEGQRLGGFIGIEGGGEGGGGVSLARARATFDSDGQTRMRSVRSGQVHRQ